MKSPDGVLEREHLVSTFKTKLLRSVEEVLQKGNLNDAYQFIN